MSDFMNFMTKGAEFYLAAPNFFKWVLPVVVAAIGGAIWLAYFLGGKFAAAEINGLKAQSGAQDQRFSLAKEQLALSVKEASELKIELEKLTIQINNHASTDVLKQSSQSLGANLNRVISANNAAQDYLVSVGFDENGGFTWRRMTPEELMAERQNKPTKP